MKNIFKISIGITIMLIGLILLYFGAFQSEASADRYSPFKVKTISLERTTLQGVNSFIGKGEATRSFNGKTFVHTLDIEASKPEPSKYYQAWLVRNKPGFEFVPTGKLIEKEGRFSLKFKDNNNFNDFTEVLVTLEENTTWNASVPGQRVLQGSFK